MIDLSSLSVPYKEGAGFLVEFVFPFALLKKIEVFVSEIIFWCKMLLYIVFLKLQIMQLLKVKRT